MRGKRPPADVLLIPIKTRLFTEKDDPVQAMKEFVTQPLPGDIATLSSCVAGLMEGRIFMEGAVEPGLLAKTLSRFVDQKDIPFGGAAPMPTPCQCRSCSRRRNRKDAVCGRGRCGLAAGQERLVLPGGRPRQGKSMMCGCRPL